MNLKFAQGRMPTRTIRHIYFNFTIIWLVLDEISKRLYMVLEDACNSCRSDLISLSGGLDSSIIAYLQRQKRPRAVAVIAKDFVSTDLTFCQIVSREMQLPLSIYSVMTDTILQAVRGTIKILKNFNDIEIRNSVVMYLAIKWARENDERYIITGDGADELFAGYSFLINKPEAELRDEIDRVCSVMHFPAQKIGRALGVSVESPFLSDSVVRLAKEIPESLKVRGEGGERHGKWILRKTFEECIPRQVVWRAKSPMQDGAGTAGLTGLFDSVTQRESFVREKMIIKERDGVIVRSRESMHYYKIFSELFGIPGDGDAENACPYCRCEIGQSKFCRMCGAFPI